MPARSKVVIPKDRIAEFCKKNHIRKLSTFGSALRDDFTIESDIDLLVEFNPGNRVGLIRLAGLEMELEEILGRRVDLNTPGFIGRHYRDRVFAEAEVQYDAA